MRFRQVTPLTLYEESMFRASPTDHSKKQAIGMGAMHYFGRKIKQSYDSLGPSALPRCLSDLLHKIEALEQQGLTQQGMLQQKR